MLTELRIRDFAIIDNLAVSLAPGFNVLSGETGAGKSIIIGALGLLLGGRGRSEDIRGGCERAIVEGTFDAAAVPAVRELLREQGLGGEDTVVVLRREVQAAGKGRAWINGFATNIGTLAEVGSMLVEVHGQHETQSLLDSRSQRDILDAFAGAVGQASEVAQLHRRLASIDRNIAETVARRAEANNRAEALQRTVTEIRAARLVEGEEVRLDEEAVRLEHAVELSELASAGAGLLTQDDRGILASIARVRRGVEAITRIDESSVRFRESVEAAELVLGELARDLEDYASRIEVDPDRLTQVNERRALLFRLSRKYGGTVAGAMEQLATAETELTELEGAEGDLAALTENRLNVHESLGRAAAELTRLRVSAAGRLSSLATALLPPLGMPAGVLHVSVESGAGIEASGSDTVSFKVQLNVGHEARDLARVASGGELSRVMLAVKSILAAVDRVPALIFDEVDAGIGGETALRVGDALRKLAARHQVLVITHLPQIAARAHHHLIVRKKERAGVATAEVEVVDGRNRVAEIARMLAGDPSSKTGLKHARELLESAASGEIR